MRAVLPWLFIVAGLGTASVGLQDAGIAFWSQQEPRVYARTASTTASFPTGFVGQLRIPRLDALVYLVDAKKPRDLRRGPGYVPGSDSPGGTNCIIAGHRDLHFRMLKDIKLGDEIDIDSMQGQFRYRVSSFEIASPTDVDSLRPVYSRQLTLVTCYPFYYLGHAPKRFIVRAKLQ